MAGLIYSTLWRGLANVLIEQSTVIVSTVPWTKVLCDTVLYSKVLCTTVL